MTLNCLNGGGICGVADDSVHLLPRISRFISIQYGLVYLLAKGCSKLLHRGVSAYRNGFIRSLCYRAAGRKIEVIRSRFFPKWFLMRSSNDEVLFLYSTR